MNDPKPNLNKETVQTVVDYYRSREAELEQELVETRKLRQSWVNKLIELQNEILDDKLSN